MKRIKNLDVAGTSHDPEIGCTKGIQGELPPPPTYLVYALVQHSPISSLSIVGSGATVLAAPATFRSRKQPTLSRRSSLQN